MMVSVVADPPQRSILGGKHAEESEHELELAAGLERAMRQQAMVPGCYAEELNSAREQKYRQGRPANTRDERTAAPEMKEDQGQHEREMAQRK